MKRSAAWWFYLLGSVASYAILYRALAPVSVGDFLAALAVGAFAGLRAMEEGR